MSAMPIEWHKECLNNQILSLETEIEIVQRSIKRVATLIHDTAIYQLQIARAELSGKGKFDSDRYAVTKDADSPERNRLRDSLESLKAEFHKELKHLKTGINETA